MSDDLAGVDIPHLQALYDISQSRGLDDEMKVALLMVAKFGSGWNPALDYTVQTAVWQAVEAYIAEGEAGENAAPWRTMRGVIADNRPLLGEMMAEYLKLRDYYETRSTATH